MRLARFARESDIVVNAPLPNALGKIKGEWGLQKNSMLHRTQRYAITTMHEHYANSYGVHIYDGPRYH